ncbi:anaerobic sulfite reductase subunit B [Sporobacter termitidis DSM 10068]|uniref:Anaerobic sulfite reductase subunit B n=1 Tax=Sporobacter termitidis DSM 10068 TaxID=1123282 RepID=A0A1M5YRV2_9FIRM|nr:anaerobic sulfite reductase subunit AsrB [Sporobacter termitidis]SHI14782.1 anaerobic sulfite reductase subunit B [Sporobacter termitidis DSM 10068]
MAENRYTSSWSEIVEVTKHTKIEYTFRLAYKGDVKPGQFFEVSLPKYGEAPISVSGIGEDTIDFTIRKVGRVTDAVFENWTGDRLFLRGPYGNGFEVSLFKGKELVIVAGGTGISPVRGVIEHFYRHPDAAAKIKLIAGFKTPDDILFQDDFRRWQERLDVTLTTDDNLGDATYRMGLVTEYIPGLEIKDLAYSAAVVVGPPAMMRFSTKALLERGFSEKDIWVSHERKMCCGIGKCGHCKIDDKYVCLDGPVFNYSVAKDFID